MGGHLSDGKEATQRRPGQHVGYSGSSRSPGELEPKVSKERTMSNGDREKTRAGHTGPKANVNDLLMVMGII